MDLQTIINTPRWPVFYHDNHLLVIYKPSGLLIQGDRTGDMCLLDLAKQWVKNKYQKPGNVFLALVHRLDRPVAGVVVFARTSKAASRLSEQFRMGSVEKQYLAIVHGEIKPSSARLADFIQRRGATSFIAKPQTPHSSVARLCYRVAGVFENKSLVEIDLETGRHHQIRVQFASRGFPIIGDLRYGAHCPLPEKQLALFARKLSFDHPTKKERMTFCSPLPSGWPWLDGKMNQNALVWDIKAMF
jgi:23S rRNA pseudouridine1911/1915/1917 synthase